MAKLPYTFYVDAFELRCALDEVWRQDEVDCIVAKHLRSGKPLSQPFRDLVAEMHEPKPHPGQGARPKTYPKHGLEIWADFRELRSLGSLDSKGKRKPQNTYNNACEILAKNYECDERTIRKIVARLRRSDKKLES